MSMQKLGRLLVVDDEVELMTTLRDMLAEQGFEVLGFTAGKDALKALRKQDFDLLLTDLMMPDMDGISLLKAGLEIDPHLVALIMTGHGTIQTAVEAMKVGAFDYVLKPFKLSNLLPVLQRALEVRRLRTDNIQLQETVAIYELSKAVAFTLDLNVVLNKVAEAAMHQCQADECSIMLPTQSGEELYVAVVCGSHDTGLGQRVPMGQGISGWVASHQEPLLLHGQVKDPRFKPIEPRRDIRSSVCMPLLSGGKLMGVLNVNVTKGGRPIALGQVKGLSILAGIAATALENAALFAQVEEAEEKYRAIFENAGEGIFQSTPEGRFLTANPALAQIWGYDSPADLISHVTDIGAQCYADPHRRAELLSLLAEQGEVRRFEFQARRKDGTVIWISENVRTVRGADGELLYYEGLARDITPRKRVEETLRVSHHFLEIANRHTAMTSLLNEFVAEVQNFTQCAAVGVRLLDEAGNIPYQAYEGFSREFYELESPLSIKSHQCMCINVITGKTDPQFPYYTTGGSFYINGTTRFLDTVPEEELGRTRNMCNQFGYESLALVPIRRGDHILGIIHVADPKEDMVPLEKVEVLERVALQLGAAIQRVHSQEMLNELRRHHEMILTSAGEGIFGLGLDGYHTFVNPAAASLLGYEVEELIGRHSHSTWHHSRPDGSPFPAEDCPIYLTFKTGAVHKLQEGFFWKKDGTGFAVEYNSSPIIENDVITGAVVTFSDITGRKKGEEALRESEQRYRRIVETALEGIWTIDAENKVTFANSRVAEMLGYHLDEIIGQPIARFFGEEWLAVASTIITERLTQGLEEQLDIKCRRKDGTDLWTIVTARPFFDKEWRYVGALGMLTDITARKEAEKDLAASVERLRKLLEEIVQAMGSVVEARDPYTSGHQRRVTQLSHTIAKELNLPQKQLDAVWVAGILHDLGKIYVPSDILNKPGRLTDLEHGIIQTHPQVGYDILKGIGFPWPVAQIVLQHHERMDGSGYPAGLKGEETFLEARILAVADVVEAMASHRPYRAALGIDKGLEEIAQNRGIRYDPEVVDVCVRLFNEKGFKLESQ